MTNNYMTASISPNPYITKKLNNMDEAKEFKKEQDDWTRLYHKTMKRLETIIDVQEKIQDMNEDSWRNEYNDHRNEGDNSKDQHQ